VKPHRRSTLIGLIAFSLASTSAIAVIEDQKESQGSHALRLPSGLSTRIQEITDLVLKHHIDPPARQQMILSGIKSLHKAAGLPVPAGLSARISAVTTREQLESLLADLWPKSTAKPLDAKDLEESVLDGLFASVSGEAHLISRKELKVNEQFAGNRYVGIHITLRNDEQAQRPVIAEVFAGGPADRAGVKSGDVLEQIDGADTNGVKFIENVNRLRGEEGTSVTIKVRQPSAAESRTYSIVRGQHPHESLRGVQTRSGGGWSFRLDGPDAIAYVKINDLMGSTPHELRKVAQQVENEGLKALVLDLRTLDGRSAHTAVLVADSLLESGLIGRIRTNKGETTYQAEPEAIFRGWPLAVLVGESTRGTGEWLAAALQDNRRAIVIGSPTQSARVNPGAGSVSSVIPLDGEWSVSLDTGILERGNGQPLSFFDQQRPTLIRSSERSRGGVHPDIALPDATPVARNVTANYPIEGSGKAEKITVTPNTALSKAVETLRASLKKT
jgi:carboxyl-terminal processing protease